MTTTEKLKLMQEIKAANDARVQEFTYHSKKHWNVDYSTRKDGVQEEDSFTVIAVSIMEALETAQYILSQVRGDYGWDDVVIWNIGIIEEDVF